jgi:HK97 family phage prohead protease
MSKTRKFTGAFEGEHFQPRAVEGTRRIEGYAIVFNQRSVFVTDWNLWKRVIEIIAPTAINDDLLKRSDVIATVEHDSRRLLARSLNGKGTLELSIDETGLKYSFECPDTADGNFVYEHVKRGNITGSSFMYVNKDDECNVTYTKETDENGKEQIIRTVNTIDKLLDVAVVMRPAYPASSVEARAEEMKELEAAIKRALGEADEDDDNEDDETREEKYWRSRQLANAALKEALDIEMRH